MPRAEDARYGDSKRPRTAAACDSCFSRSGMPACEASRCRSATLARSSRLLLPQQQVDDPTATHMRTRHSQMDEELLVSAAGIFESVGEHSEAVSVEGAGRQL